MTPQEIKARVDSLRESSETNGDSETLHHQQDDLFRDVLSAIANGECDQPKDCAAEAIKVNDVEFSRWYA